MMAGTHTPFDARRVFPCWDDPSLPVIVGLTLVVPDSFTAFSNMPLHVITPCEDAPSSSSSSSSEMYKEVVFLETPSPICTYLIAFCAGDFDVRRVHAKAADGGKGAELVVYTPTDTIDHETWTGVVVEHVAQALNGYDDDCEIKMLCRCVAQQCDEGGIDNGNEDRSQSLLLDRYFETQVLSITRLDSTKRTVNENNNNDRGSLFLHVPSIEPFVREAASEQWRSSNHDLRNIKVIVPSTDSTTNNEDDGIFNGTYLIVNTDGNRHPDEYVYVREDGWLSCDETHSQDTNRRFVIRPYNSIVDGEENKPSSPKPHDYKQRYLIYNKDGNHQPNQYVHVRKDGRLQCYGPMDVHHHNPNGHFIIEPYQTLEGEQMYLIYNPDGPRHPNKYAHVRLDGIIQCYGAMVESDKSNVERHFVIKPYCPEACVGFDDYH